MSQVVIFQGPTGRVLSASLYLSDGSALVATASSCVEQSLSGGAPGVFAATFSGVAEGTYLLSAFDSSPAVMITVAIAADPGTYSAITPATPLQELITSPQRVRTDEGTVEERPIKEIIQGDVYNRLDQQANVKGASIMSRWGIVIARTRPPDALGNQKPDPFGPRFL